MNTAEEMGGIAGKKKKKKKKVTLSKYGPGHQNPRDQLCGEAVASTVENRRAKPGKIEGNRQGRKERPSGKFSKLAAKGQCSNDSE